jgi:F-type H+-transporting ATPase subunit gamma
MPSLKAIRKRISSVRSTQKITRAMKLVAAARLRKAQEQIIAARPYARRLHEVISELATRAGEEAHPLLGHPELHRVQLLVLTSDRGLCGAFNSNVARRAERFLADNQGKIEDVSLAVLGKRGREYFRRRQGPVRREHGGVTTQVAQARAREIAKAAIDDFCRHDLDGVFLVYNEFKSAMSQRVTVEPILPVTPLVLPESAGHIDFIYEPSRRVLLDQLLPLYVEVEVYRAILESIASEFGARMTAMENATNNATEMIAKLTLQFNRARQAAITKELMEIIGGAEALKG